MQPESQLVNYGTNAIFKVQAQGSQPLRYQWWFSNSLMIWKGTNTTLILTNVDLAMAGNYSVVIKNAQGTITSQAAVLTVRDLATRSGPQVLWKKVGHRNRITSVAVSPDSTQAASASMDGTVKVWGIEDGKLQFEIMAGDYGVQRVTFLSDNRTLATLGYEDNLLQLWDAGTGNNPSTISINSSNLVMTMAFTPQDYLLGAGTMRIESAVTGFMQVTDNYYGSVELRSLSGPSFIRSYPEVDGRVLSAPFSADGKLLAYQGGQNGDILVFSTNSAAIQHRLQGHLARYTPSPLPRMDPRLLPPRRTGRCASATRPRWLPSAPSWPTPAPCAPWPFPVMERGWPPVASMATYNSGN